MIERSIAVAQAVEAPPYTYQKRSVMESLDPDGQVMKTEEKVYQVTLIGGFPFRRLASIQGRALSPEELSREDAREQKFRQRFVSMDPRNPIRRKRVW